MASDSQIMLNYDKIENSGKDRSDGSNSERSQMRLNPEEIRILKECNRESFYYRCLPMALAGMAAAHIAVKRGFMKPHPKWGSAFKQTGAAVIGWFVGKLSYRSVCEEKFLRLQNSSIGDMIRKKRGYSLESFSDFSSRKDDDYISAGDSGLPLSDSEYHSSFGSLNLDTDKNVQYSGLDDRERPSMDGTSDSVSEEKSPQRSVTYDQLRRRNRENYEQQFRSQSSSSSSQQRTQQRPWMKQEDSKTEGSDAPKNKYGDSWER